MKNNDFTECPMCGGQLEEHTTLNHPIKGLIPDIPHHACSNCSEVFLNGEEFDIVHSYGRKEKAVA